MNWRGEGEKRCLHIVVIDELADDDDRRCKVGCHLQDCPKIQSGDSPDCRYPAASVDVITSLIKANITTRIAFAVSSQADSLSFSIWAPAVGREDMLYHPVGAAKPGTCRAHLFPTKKWKVVAHVLGRPVPVLHRLYGCERC